MLRLYYEKRKTKSLTETQFCCVHSDVDHYAAIVVVDVATTPNTSKGGNEGREKKQMEGGKLMALTQMLLPFFRHFSPLSEFLGARQEEFEQSSNWNVCQVVHKKFMDDKTSMKA